MSQNEPKWTKMGQSGSKWVKMGQNGPTWAKMEEYIIFHTEQKKLE